MSTPSASAESTVQRRLIHKVLILGNHTPLQVGYLSEVVQQNLACHLYSTLGVSIGVTTIQPIPTLSVTLQLWAVPLNERYRGLTSTFVRGHSSALVIIRSDGTDHIPQIDAILNDNGRKSVTFVVVGPLADAECFAEQVSDYYKRPTSVHSITDVHETIRIAVNRIVYSQGDASPIQVLSLPEEACPEFEGVPDRLGIPLNTEAEVTMIKDFARSCSLDVSKLECLISLNEGFMRVDFSSGNATFEPILCDLCSRDCKRSINICIVGVDDGWSSEGLGKRALLTMAKIQGLATRSLPLHVENQIHQASQCSRFILGDRDLRDIMDGLFDNGIVMKDDLLEVALRRVKDGRLSSSAYDILKRRLDETLRPHT